MSMLGSCVIINEVTGNVVTVLSLRDIFSGARGEGKKETMPYSDSMSQCFLGVGAAQWSHLHLIMF